MGERLKSKKKHLKVHSMGDTKAKKKGVIITLQKKVSEGTAGKGGGQDYNMGHYGAAEGASLLGGTKVGGDCR